jgi:C4-dicarboxylate transporter DctM subunit
MLTFTLFGSMLLLMLGGVPIVFAIGLAALVGTLIIPDVPWIVVPTAMYNGMDSFPLMAIPFFLMAGELMNRGGIAERLIAFAQALIGHVRGGLGHTTVVSNTLLAMDTGSALAQVAAIGRIMIPAMERGGYPRANATAITCAASLIGPIIPPSITMVIYAVAAGASVGALFLAAIVPGLLIAVSMMAYIYVMARREKLPVGARFSLGALGATGARAVMALLMPFIILGGVFAGVMTPTESAAVAVLYAMLVGVFVFRKLTLKDLYECFLNTGIVSGFIMVIVGAARIFSDLLASEMVPQALMAGLLEITRDPALMMLLINLLLLVVGCLMDTTAAIIILVPVLLPAIKQIGIDPTLFGLVMCINLVIGLATPPVGAALYLASSIGRVRLEALVRAIWPLLLVQIGVLLVITYVPDLSLTIPRYFGYLSP